MNCYNSYDFRASLANGGYDQEQFNEVSTSAIECIQGLLVLEPAKRMTANQTLGHKWLTTTYLDNIKSLETSLIRKYLARRRWHRWYNAIKAMNRMKSFARPGSSVTNESHQETEESIGLPEFNRTNSPPKKRPDGRWV